MKQGSSSPLLSPGNQKTDVGASQRIVLIFVGQSKFPPTFHISTRLWFEFFESDRRFRLSWI